jgi:hypothetical protein
MRRMILRMCVAFASLPVGAAFAIPAAEASEDVGEAVEALTIFDRRIRPTVAINACLTRAGAAVLAPACVNNITQKWSIIQEGATHKIRGANIPPGGVGSRCLHLPFAQTVVGARPLNIECGSPTPSAQQWIVVLAPPPFSGVGHYRIGKVGPAGTVWLRRDSMATSVYMDSWSAMDIQYKKWQFPPF